MTGHAVSSLSRRFSRRDNMLRHHRIVHGGRSRRGGRGEESGEGGGGESSRGGGGVEESGEGGGGESRRGGGGVEESGDGGGGESRRGGGGVEESGEGGGGESSRGGEIRVITKLPNSESGGGGGSGGVGGSGGRGEGTSIDWKPFSFVIPSRQTLQDRPAVERRISLKRCYKAVGARWRYRCRESSGCTRDGNHSTMR